MSKSKSNINNDEIKVYKPLLKELVFRDVKLKYRRSVLGYLWSLLNPLLMMAIMSIVFSYMFKSNIEYFPLYLICGNTLFAFFTDSTTQAMYSILSNGMLLRKVKIPKMVFPIAKVLSSFTMTSFSLVAILIVMVVMRVKFCWTILFFWVPLLFLLIFCMGMGLILSSLAVFFRDTMHLYSVITMAWMYITPIFYPVDPEFLPGFVIKIINMNPLYHYINFFRSVVIYGTMPSAFTWIASIVSSALFFVIGLLVFKKTEKNFIFYI